MIKITALSSPHSGKTRVVPADVDAMELLTQFAKADWRWSIDFSNASEQEVFEWGRADMVARILAALLHGRSIWFLGKEYFAQNQADLPKVIGAVEDAIAYSGLMVQVKSDDENGVIIGTGGTEHPVQ